MDNDCCDEDNTILRDKRDRWMDELVIKARLKGELRVTPAMSIENALSARKQFEYAAAQCVLMLEDFFVYYCWGRCYKSWCGKWIQCQGNVLMPVLTNKGLPSWTCRIDLTRAKRSETHQGAWPVCCTLITGPERRYFLDTTK